jgi:hypothetical protein
MGRKTTIRFVNRKYTDSLVNGDGAASDYKEGETILFWNLFTAPYLNHIKVGANISTSEPQNSESWGPWVSPATLLLLGQGDLIVDVTCRIIIASHISLK